MIDITAKFLLIWINFAINIERYHFWSKYRKYVFSNLIEKNCVLFVVFDCFNFCGILSFQSLSAVLLRYVCDISANCTSGWCLSYEIKVVDYFRQVKELYEFTFLTDFWDTLYVIIFILMKDKSPTIRSLNKFF
jgi:hypothetical protein